MKLNLLRDSVGLKALIVGFLVLILMIPTVMVMGLVHERKVRRNEVISEISDKWGEHQTISGPILSVPYRQYFRDKEGVQKHSIEYLHFLPNNLSIKGELFPEKRYRSLYETVVYKSEIHMEGDFSFPDLSGLGVKEEDVEFEDAFFSLGVSDTKGISEKLEFTINGAKLKLEPGLICKDVLASGVHARYPLKSTNILKFEIATHINGSEYIHFTPVGKETNVQLKSSWPDPSFSGNYLPAHREISQKGFSASWKVLNLNRNYPQRWRKSEHKISRSSFGVKLFIEADVYQQSMRSVKYGFMFILFTFTAFFFCEILNHRRVHPIQYLLIGLAITIFYTLLLSISEYIDFNSAYWISTSAIVLMITSYAKSVLKSTKMSLTVGTILLILYIYLFILLQLEDKALLLGSIGLFTVLGIAMYVTRNIDWYSLSSQPEDK